MWIRDSDGWAEAFPVPTANRRRGSERRLGPASGERASLADTLEVRLQALGGPDNIDAAYQADLDALMAIEVEIAVVDLACK